MSRYQDRKLPYPEGGQPFSFGNYDPVNHLFYAEYPGNFCP